MPATGQRQTARQTPAKMLETPEDALRKLPAKDGFRLRGMDMTRTETFTDAAFAFAFYDHFVRLPAR